MSVSEYMGRWIDLTAHLLSQGAEQDPMVEICNELAAQFDAEVSGTVDYSEARTRIGIYSVRGPDASPYVERVGNHPLAMHFCETHDSHARSLADARRFQDDPRARALLERLREDEMNDFIFLPLLPRGRMDHRWLALSSSQSLTSGARDDIDRLGQLIRALDANSQVLAPRTAETAVKRSSIPSSLSNRERAVLVLIASGLTATAIGYRLHVSPRTVSKHQQNVYRKLDVGDRLGAVLRAQQLGLLPPARVSLVRAGYTMEAAVDGHQSLSTASASGLSPPR